MNHAEALTNHSEPCPSCTARRDRAAARQAALDAGGAKIIVLVACTAIKAGEPRRACELYTSQWFQKARAYAEAFGDEWRILSARWGLIHPGDITAPYNCTLNNFSRRERERWAADVAASVRYAVPYGSRIIMLAGTAYRDPLETMLLRKGYTVDAPLRGLGIGQQLTYLKTKVENTR